MGSAISAKSSKLIKPEDCSVEVWKKILQLFDKLDTDGTHSIEDAEWDIFKLRWKHYTGESIND